jgi:hypothetical protein
MPKPGLAVIAVATLVACARQPAIAPTPGAAPELSALVGEWVGDYSSPSESGTLSLIVIQARDTAIGHIVIRPVRGASYTAADVTIPAHQLHSPTPDALSIAFVRTRSGIIEGTTEKYLSPDCFCRAKTMFQASLTGGTLQGQFTTTAENGRRQEGRWTAQRMVIAN